MLPAFRLHFDQQHAEVECIDELVSNDLLQIEPVLEAMEDVMARLAHALEGRVYVAVCRGLWDFTAKEVFDYVEGLQEGREHKVPSPVMACPIARNTAEIACKLITILGRQGALCFDF